MYYKKYSIKKEIKENGTNVFYEISNLILEFDWADILLHYKGPQEGHVVFFRRNNAHYK